MIGKGFIFKTLLVFWLVGVVLVKSAHQKRDVHHRIILQEPRPMRSNRSKHTKYHQHTEERPHKSKKKSHKNVDSEETFSHPSEDGSYEEYLKKQTKSKNRYTSHHKSPKSTSKYHPKVTYHYQEPSEPPTTYHENFKENIHHFENIENSKQPKWTDSSKWPGPFSSSNEYFLSSPKETYIGNNQEKGTPNDYKYSSERFEYQQPSESTFQYYKSPVEFTTDYPGKESPKDNKYSTERFEYHQPSESTFEYYKSPVEFTTDYPERHTHNYQYDSNSYKPFSTSFQQFESNKKKVMEALPLISTIENGSGAMKRDARPKYEYFRITEASKIEEDNNNPLKIVVENSEEDHDIKIKGEEVNKDKKKRLNRNKNKQKGNWKNGQVHKIKKTVYE